ncbi:alpha/beta fold hydrolase [Actinospongicola halichondriae]|uniref:alpha/beta fold hydrolase n=1 Tax=Actinospongicola halichondriae TaxID=3236844 RepID=UPI003D4DF8FF
MATAWEPRLPPGQVIDLPGRGSTFVRELPGPDPSAPTVVLLHGWTVNADLNWFPSYDALAERFRVVTIDHRGHGRGIRSRRRFRLADCADDVAALCAALDIDRAMIAGYSMGGPIAMLTWHRHRTLVDGLVLCATAPIFRRSGAGRIVSSALPVVAGLGRLTPPRARQAVAGRLLGQRLEDGDLGRWARSQIGLGDPVAVAEAGAAIGRFDNRSWLGDIDVPTVVVRTTRDLAVPPARQTTLASSIPGAAVIDVDADHGGCITAADRFVPALVRACASVAHAPGARERTT